jgi:hypothetical protein
MSKGGGGSAAQPASVDPTALAAAQTGSNVTTAQTQAALNNASTYSPFGSSIWTPSTNAQGQTTYSLNQSLSPQLSQLFGGQTNLASLLSGSAAPGVAASGMNLANLGQNLFGAVGNAAGQVPTQLNMSGVAPITQLSPSSFQTNVAAGPIQTGVGSGGPIQSGVGQGGPIQSGVNTNFGQLVQQAQNAAYQSQTQYLDPQFQQGQEALQQQLADQGIQEGTPAYSRAMLDFNNQKQQAYQSAQDQAVAAGNQQQQALFGESLGAGQFANAAQAQQFGQGVTAGTFANQAQQQLFGQALAGGTFANQAQQQQFGQGLSLADLYNQAVLGAAGQQNTAVGLGMQEAQAQAQQPMNALQALLAGASGATNAGLGSLGAAGQFINQAPTWPLSIPTFGGQATTVAPTNMAQTQAAATGANTLANQALTSNLSGLTGVASPLLFGSGGISNALGLGSSGLFGSLFGAGGGAASSLMLPGTSSALADTGAFAADALML